MVKICRVYVGSFLFVDGCYGDVWGSFPIVRGLGCHRVLPLLSPSPPSPFLCNVIIGCIVAPVLGHEVMPSPRCALRHGLFVSYVHC